MAGAASVRPGRFNDPDMLQVANFLFADGNLDALEMRTHFALWSIMGAPLILGHASPTLPMSRRPAA